MENKPPPGLISDRVFLHFAFDMNPSVDLANTNNNILTDNRTVTQILRAPTTSTLDMEGKTNSPLIVFEVGGIEVPEGLEDLAYCIGCWCCLCGGS